MRLICLPLAAVGAVALLGCGRPPVVAVRSERVAEGASVVATPTQPAAKPADTVLEMEARVRGSKSLEAARPLLAEVQKRVTKTEQALLLACVNAKGVKFDGLFGAPALNLGDHTFGIQIPSIDGAANGFAQLENLSGGVVRPTDPALLAALEGDLNGRNGCRESVGKELDRFGVEANRSIYLRIVGEFENRKLETIESDPQLPVVSSKWRECMRAQGVSSVTTRQNLLRKYLGQPTKTADEVAAASADAICSVSSGLNDLLLQVGEREAVGVVTDFGPDLLNLQKMDEELLQRLPA